MSLPPVLPRSGAIAARAVAAQADLERERLCSALPPSRRLWPLASGALAALVLALVLGRLLA